MVLTKEELNAALQHEVKVLLHLASKVEPEMVDYRPTPKQRSTLELLQYLAVFGQIHLQAVMAESFDMDWWRATWTREKAAAAELDLEGVKAALARSTLQVDCSDEALRTEIEMFGRKASRGSMLISLVLSHYPAYRMQLFLYLKSCGREDLNTMNLWVGMDAK